jgi:hypothetical protein
VSTTAGKARIGGGRARMPVGGAHGCWEVRMHVGRAHTPARRGHARQLGGAHARGEGAHLGGGGAHGGGRVHTGMGRARTPVKRRAVVVEGTPKGKASICKRSFLLNYPQSEYID